MKNMKRFWLALLAIAVMMPAMAQFSIGPRLGVNVNKFSLDESVFDSDNRAGFTGGIEIEVMIPMVNFGFDLSAMYVRRSGQVAVDVAGVKNVVNVNNDYIEIPLNLKYKFGLPLVGKIISPYIFTGPSFAFLTSKEAVKDFARNKKCDIAWNFGLGLQLFRHLQVGASYGLGMTKAFNAVSGGDHQAAGIEGKNRYWTITAAWLF